MADWPLVQGQWSQTYGSVPASSSGTAVTASGTIHTKGSWAQLIAAASNVINAVGVLVFIRASQNGPALVDIGVGAAASEQVIIPNLLIDSRNNDGCIYYFPVSIPTGTRIAARAQSINVSDGLQVSICLIGGGLLPSQPLSQVTDYGTVTASSQGTEVDPGAVANTDSAWVQLVASTTSQIDWLTVAISVDGSHAGLGAHPQMLVDIAVGAAASEVEILSDLPCWNNAAGGTCCGPVGPVPIHIPIGTRLSARARSSSTLNPGRKVAVIAYGVN